MEFRYSTYRVRLRHTFRISRSSKDFCDVIFVFLTRNGITGIGEASPSDRYNETFDGLLGILEQVTLAHVDDSYSLDEMLSHVLPECKGFRSLEAAFDMAAHDLWGKMNDTPLYEKFGAKPEETPLTSFTVGIDEPHVIEKKIEEAERYPILKVKLGSQHDRAIITAVRNMTDKPIRVDANEGWTIDRALRMCEWLATKNVEFVEQPLPADRIEDTVKLKERSPVKIIADENCMDSRDIPDIANAFHGINIKLMKCGGQREAYRMIRLGRDNGLEIMLGCMIETSVAITAAAHLSPLVDYADLDGHILIDNDPYKGVMVEKGKLVLPAGPGLGVDLR